MSAVVAQYDALKALVVGVFSVNVDSQFVHKIWNDEELSKMVDGCVRFHMLSDQTDNIGRAYGAYDDQQGIELRGRFIIDPDGVVQAMEVMPPPVASSPKRSGSCKSSSTSAPPAARKRCRPVGGSANRRSNQDRISSARSGTRRWSDRSRNSLRTPLAWRGFALWGRTAVLAV